jgi:hypothetical protein
MSKTITKFKFFFPHEDEQQEAWLRSLAQQGLHLEWIHPLSFWIFRRGEPADVVYRVDSPQFSEDPDFRQLMQDAGWSLAASTVGWRYWRMPAVPGTAPELFSDNKSKARKFQQRLRTLLASSLSLCVLLLVLDIPGNLMSQVSLPFLVPYCSVLALYLLFVPYSVLHLARRIRTLNRLEAT